MRVVAQRLTDSHLHENLFFSEPAETGIQDTVMAVEKKGIPIHLASRPRRSITDDMIVLLPFILAIIGLCAGVRDIPDSPEDAGAFFVMAAGCFGLGIYVPKVI